MEYNFCSFELVSSRRSSPYAINWIRVCATSFPIRFSRIRYFKRFTQIYYRYYFTLNNCTVDRVWHFLEHARIEGRAFPWKRGFKLLNLVPHFWHELLYVQQLPVPCIHHASFHSSCSMSSYETGNFFAPFYDYLKIILTDTLHVNVTYYTSPRLDDLLIILFRFDFRCRYVTTRSMSTSYLYVSNHGHGRAFYRLLFPLFLPFFPCLALRTSCRKLFIVSVYQRDNYVPRSPLFRTNHIVALLANFFFTFAAIVSSNDYRDIRAASRKCSSACHGVFFTSTLRETFSSFFNTLTRQETSTLTRLTKITRHGRCFNG